MTKRYPIVIVPLPEDEGGGYAAYAPDLYGCLADGDTVSEASENIADAIAEWCDEAVRLGRDIPEPGTAAKAAQAERAKVVELLEEQQRLLQEQDKLLNEKYTRLQEQVATLAENIDSYAFDTPSGLGWGAVPVMPNHLASKSLSERRKSH